MAARAVDDQSEFLFFDPSRDVAVGTNFCWLSSLNCVSAIFVRWRQHTKKSSACGSLDAAVHGGCWRLVA